MIGKTNATLKENEKDLNNAKSVIKKMKSKVMRSLILGNPNLVGMNLVRNLYLLQILLNLKK